MVYTLMSGVDCLSSPATDQPNVHPDFWKRDGIWSYSIQLSELTSAVDNPNVHPDFWKRDAVDQPTVKPDFWKRGGTY